MKGYFKSLKTVVKVNSSGGFECPSCSLSESQAPFCPFWEEPEIT